MLFVVLANGRYAVMDRLAKRHGQGKAPWPAFEQVSIQQLALGSGCPAQRVDSHDALVSGDFDLRRQIAELKMVVGSPSAAKLLAENYVGLPLA